LDAPPEPVSGSPPLPDAIAPPEPWPPLPVVFAPPEPEPIAPPAFPPPPAAAAPPLPLAGVPVPPELIAAPAPPRPPEPLAPPEPRPPEPPVTPPLDPPPAPPEPVPVAPPEAEPLAPPPAPHDSGPGPGTMNSEPSRHVGALPPPPSTVTVMVAWVALTAVAVMLTPPIGSVNVCPTGRAASLKAFDPVVAGVMSSKNVCRPRCVRLCTSSAT
jgi:hypothetical protein